MNGINNTNLQVEDKLWDDVLLNQSNGTASPSSSSQPRPEGAIVTANLDELFQFGAAIYRWSCDRKSTNQMTKMIVIPALIQDTATVVAVIHKVSEFLKHVFLTARET